MRRFRVLAGLVITVVGAVWLVSRLGGVTEALPAFQRWWPIAAVALGVLNLLALVKRPTWLLAPLLLIAGGGLGLLATLGRELPPDVQPYIWPVVVTVIGVAIALWEREWIEGNDEFVRETVVFRSRRFHSTTTQFQHGVVRAFLGNLELDLQRCELEDNSELCVTAVLGHVDLLPPPGCQVQLEGRRFGLGLVVPALPPLDPDEPETTLPVLKVSVLGFMGGFDLRPVWNREAATVLDAAKAEATEPPPEISALMADGRS